MAKVGSTVSYTRSEKLKPAIIVLPGEFFVVSYKQSFHVKNKSLKMRSVMPFMLQII